MCGLAGVLSHSPLPFNEKSVLRAFSHRGPDAQDSVHLKQHNHHVWLGHARLSILDLSEAGAQPMFSSDRRWVVVFNGEIYNHQSLRSKNHSYKGSSDTETLVELLSQIGIQQTLSQLNGMFAFAAFDTEKGQIHLVRDPFGIKPLYIHYHKNTLYFASEIRTLAAMGVPLELHSDSLQTFLTLRYTPSPYTLLQDIERVPPGHHICWDIHTHEFQKQCFISPTAHRLEGSKSVVIRTYENELRAAVSRQLLSDVPVGLLLSGGIDSALIAAMAKEQGYNLNTYTVGFGTEHFECEIDDARHTANILSLPHHHITVTPSSLWSAFPDIVQSIEEPLGTTSILPMWALVQRAREDVTVVLTGQGSDEPWGGYRKYQQELLRENAPNWLWKQLRHVPSHPKLPDFIKRGLISLPEKNIGMRLLLNYELCSAGQRERLTGRSDQGQALERILHWLEWQHTGKTSVTEQQMRIDARMNLADDLLLYGDKISMAFGLEARVPMLDLRLMEFIESLPLSCKRDLRRGKIIHKAMAEQYLPKEIVYRKKKGFQVPFGKWCRDDWKEHVSEILLTSGAPHLSELSKKELENIWNQHQQGIDNERILFSLLSFAFWYRNIKAISRNNTY